jgi:hypothetical protein
MPRRDPQPDRWVILSDTPVLACGPYRRDIPYRLPADEAERLVAIKGFRFIPDPVDPQEE